MPALQGCHSQGDTFEEALSNIQDITELCLEDLIEEHKGIDIRFPEIVGIKNTKVTV